MIKVNVETFIKNVLYYIVIILNNTDRTLSSKL